MLKETPRLEPVKTVLIWASIFFKCQTIKRCIKPSKNSFFVSFLPFFSKQKIGPGKKKCL